MLFTERGSIVSIWAFSLRVPVIAQEIPFQGWDRFPLFGSVSQRVLQTKVRSFLGGGKTPKISTALFNQPVY